MHTAESTYFIQLWNTLLVHFVRVLPQLPVPLGVCIFFKLVMRSCVKNVLKNSHAETYQNLFLCNHKGIFSEFQPHLKTWNECSFLGLFVSFVSLFFFFFAPFWESWKSSVADSDTQVSPYCTLCKPIKTQHEPDVQVFVYETSVYITWAVSRKKHINI